MGRRISRSDYNDALLGLGNTPDAPTSITEGLIGALTGGRITAENASQDEYVDAVRRLRESDTLKYNEYVNTLLKSSKEGDGFSGSLFKLARSKGLFEESDIQSTLYSAAERGLGWLRGAGDLVATGLDITGFDSAANKLRDDISAVDKAKNPSLNQDFSKPGQVGSGIGTVANVVTEFGLAAATGGSTLAGVRGAGAIASRVAPRLSGRVASAAAKQTARTPRLAKAGRYIARESGIETGYLVQDIADAAGQQRITGEFNFSPKLTAAFLAGEIALAGPLGFGVKLLKRSLDMGSAKQVGDIIAGLPSKAKKDLEVEWAKTQEGGGVSADLNFIKQLRKVSDKYLPQEDRVFLSKLEGQAELRADIKQSVDKAREAGESSAKKGLTDVDRGRFDELNSKSQFDKLDKAETTELEGLRTRAGGEQQAVEEFATGKAAPKSVDKALQAYAKKSGKEVDELTEVEIKEVLDKVDTGVAAKKAKPVPTKESTGNRISRKISELGFDDLGDAEESIGVRLKDNVGGFEKALDERISQSKPLPEPKVKPKPEPKPELPPKLPPPAKKAVKDTPKAEKATTKPTVAKKEIKAKKVKAETAVKKIDADGIPTTLQAIPVGKIAPIKPGSDAASIRAEIKARNQKLIDDEIIKSEATIKDVDRFLSEIARETGQQKLLAPVKPEIQPTTAKAVEAARKVPRNAVEQTGQDMIDDIPLPVPAGQKRRQRAAIEGGDGAIRRDAGAYTPQTVDGFYATADDIIKGRTPQQMIKALKDGKIKIDPQRHETVIDVLIYKLRQKGKLTQSNLREISALVSGTEVTGAAQTIGLRGAVFKSIGIKTSQSNMLTHRSLDIYEAAGGDLSQIKQLRGESDKLTKELLDIDERQVGIANEIKTILKPKAVLAEGEVDVAKIIKARRINEAAEGGIKTADPRGFATTDEAIDHFKTLGNKKLVTALTNYKKRLNVLNKNLSKKGINHDLELYYSPDGNPIVMLNTKKVFDNEDELAKDLAKMFKGIDQGRILSELDSVKKANDLTGRAVAAEKRLVRESSKKIDISGKIEQLKHKANAMASHAEGKISAKGLKQVIKSIDKEYTAWEKGIHFYKNNLLSAPQTTALAISSSALNSFGMRGIERMLGYADEMRRKAFGEKFSFLTPIKYIPPKTRKIVSETIAKTADPNLEVFTDSKDLLWRGGPDYWDRLTHGRLPSSGQKFDARPSVYKHRWVNAANNTAFPQCKLPRPNV